MDTFSFTNGSPLDEFELGYVMWYIPSNKAGKQPKAGKQVKAAVGKAVKAKATIVQYEYELWS